MRTFKFNWHKQEPNWIARKTDISAKDAETAVGVFMQHFGNLKKNVIDMIQEVDDCGNPVGDPIIPDNESLEAKDYGEL